MEAVFRPESHQKNPKNSGRNHRPGLSLSVIDNQGIKFQPIKPIMMTHDGDIKSNQPQPLNGQVK